VKGQGQGNPAPYLNGNAPKLSPALRAWVLARANEGKQSDEIAELLKSEHGAEVCSRTIRRIIRLARTERADAAKSVVRAELRTHLIPAIERMARAALRAEKIGKRWLDRAEKIRETKPDSELADDLEERALRASDRVTKNSVALLHYAGLDQPDDLNKLAKPAAERRALLLKRLEELTRPQLPPATNGTQAN
jgi:hypothetical protein